MLMGLKYGCLALLSVCSCLSMLAQADPELFNDSLSTRAAADSIVIGEIVIEGNKRTIPYIIRRELPFEQGQSFTLSNLVHQFEIARQQLMNTRLFNEAIVSVRSFRGSTADILIQVKERWYLFPLPYLKPVDRNLAEWAKQGYGTDRLKYGFKFTYYNFTGRNDKLKMWFITGYTKQIQFQYEQPYADKSLKHGFRVGLLYSFNREINYATLGNHQAFIDSLDGGIRNWNGYVDYVYRPGLRTFHSVRLSVTKQRVDSQILELNPKFFSSQSNEVTFPDISYLVEHYNVDYIPYPLKGWMGEASLTRRGLHSNVGMWQLAGKITQGWETGKKTYYGHQIFGVLRVPFDQPFINQRLMGYSDLYMRGLENYVVDGVASAVSKHTFRLKLAQFSLPTYLKSRSHDRIPFRIYAKAYSDLGYVHNKSYFNSLNNRFLYTGGFGVDIVTFYDFVLRVDYSFNQLGEKGLFLHIKNDF